MNVMFLTMTDIPDLECRYIYTELLKIFIQNGHKITIISPKSEKKISKYEIIEKTDYKLLKIRILSGGKNNLIKKAINTIALESWYLTAVKKYLSAGKFDLVLYSTPPVTLEKTIQYIKRRDHARTYLMLKDIFPQNAVDLGIMTTIGPKSIIYSIFRKKEKRLYQISDYIGCMSDANVNYLLRHNTELNPDKVGLCVNCVIPAECNEIEKTVLRRKFEIPENRIVFFYGGNFGKPQGIPHFVTVLEENRIKEDRYFVLCGDGTDYEIVNKLVCENHCSNIRLIKGLPKKDYDDLLKACDVGMLFLDYRFTIPNFPSRILTYMEYSMPVLACTDPNTDIGNIIEKGGFGWHCLSNKSKNCTEILDQICRQGNRLEDIKTKGEAARIYLEKHFTAEIAYRQIIDKYRN